MLLENSKGTCLYSICAFWEEYGKIRIRAEGANATGEKRIFFEAAPDGK